MNNQKNNKRFLLLILLAFVLAGCGSDDTCETSDNKDTTAGDTLTSTNSLRTEQQLVNDEYLVSENGEYRFYLQGDGNLVLRDWATRDASWSPATHDQGGIQVRLQGDGNLVLRNSNGDALWSSETQDTGTDRLVLNNNGSLVLYSGDNIEWTVGNSPDEHTPPDDGECTGDGGNNGGEGDTSSGRFSSPSAALYSLNDDLQRAFPRHIDTNFSGNGHTETWDGRVFVIKRSGGWYAAAFRPERIGRNSDGTPILDGGAFGNRVALELEGDAQDIHQNWIAAVADPSVTGENPYPSNSGGTYRSNGTYRTYKTLMYHTSTRNGDNDQMGIRRATIIVSNANTQNAQVISADFTSSFTKLRTTSGSDFRCIEPSVTMDSRLIICQGHPDNNGGIDNLIYGWNSTPGATSGWSVPKSLSNMYYDDRTRSVDGIPFYVRFPIAERPLLDATGAAYERGELVKGAYPWISHDGAELFYQASRENMPARRTGTTVVGRWTGWIFRHIDGPINRNRYETSRLFLSSPGAFTTMWAPYKDIENLPIPYATRGPSYPLIGSNTSDYMEVGFEDYLDGNYVMYLGMNEQLERSGAFQITRTPDTSGQFNNASLQGAKFPIEYNGKDELVGRYGQAIYFPTNTYLQIDRNDGWSDLVNGVTVDLFLKINATSSARVNIFQMQNGVELYLENGRRLSAKIHDDTGDIETLNGDAVATGRWVHLAFTFNPSDKKMTLYMDGEKIADKTVSSFGTLMTSGNVKVGPENSQGLYLIDEVKVSNLARNDYEISHNAFVKTHQAPNQALARQIPSHYSSLSSAATGVDQFSLASAELGEHLFEDKILSKQQTTSCATCHDPQQSFTDGLVVAKGNEPTDNGVRNTPMLHNRLFSSLQGWGGGAFSLDTQALTPIQAEHEMNLPIGEAATRLSNNTFYASQFQQVFGEPPNKNNIPLALASFQAIQFAPKNRFDEFKEGNVTVLSGSEYRGALLFEGKARCSGCHAGRNYTDESFRSNGLADNGDLGRSEITGRNRDFKLFKVPSLRLVRDTAPYMHDGSINTLKAVVEAYNDASSDFESVDTDIRPLELTGQEIDDLVDFLNLL